MLGLGGVGKLLSLWFCFLLHSILHFDHAPKTILYLAILDSVPRYLRLRT